MTYIRNTHQTDFVRTAMTTTYRHGEHLNQATDRITYDSYSDHSHTVETEGITTGLTIGRVAVSSIMYGQCLLTTRLSMLHEAAGMMPSGEHGQLLGSLALDLKKAATEDRKFPNIVQLDWSFYTDNSVHLDLAELDLKHGFSGGIRETGQLLSDIKQEALYAALGDNGYSTLRGLPMDEEQTLALTDYVVRQFK